MILRPITGNCIQQQIPDVYLKHRKIIPVHRHHKLNLRTGPIRHRRREVIPLPSRMTPNPKLLNLDLSQHPVPAEILCSAQRQLKPQLHIKQRHHLRTHKIQTENRKRIKPPGSRRMLISQLSKPMISRHEQVIPTDTIPIPIRRTMRSHTLCIPYPPILLL